MESNPPKQFYWTLVLAEVLFLADGQMQALKQQFHTKSDIEFFPAQRLAQLQRAAVMQVQQATQGNGVCKDFQAIEVFLLQLVPLGQMSDEEFFAQSGMMVSQTVDPMAEADAAEAAQAAANEAASVPATDASEERPSATVHTLRPTQDADTNEA